MRKPALLLVTLLAGAGLGKGEIKTLQNAPIEITSTGETTYENGLATARDNVAIHVGDTDIYADYAQYNSSTHEVDLRGHVRIYHDKPTAANPKQHPNKFNAEEPGIKHDILVVGTEAGIDTALFWNGQNYVLFSPAEEP
jgi:lipopolysaccharide assembly outer membrane protein LptD (OstA)